MPMNAGANPADTKSAMESSMAPCSPRAQGPSHGTIQDITQLTEPHTARSHKMPSHDPTLFRVRSIQASIHPRESSHSAEAQPKSNSDAAHQHTSAPDPSS